ncbi:hypothetical protein [Daejeonella sp.]|uniref:hypothetical protein n=1 Tax=Daejeonella sp. TaxID=2805397 RepID=UPI0030BFB48E
MKNLSLLLITGILLIACDKKEESLAGRQFQLMEAGTGKTPVIVHISFVNEQRMDVWTLRGSSGDVVITPYQFEDGLLTFRGAIYEAKENKLGFDLYRGETLAYKLIRTYTRVKTPVRDHQPRIKVDKNQQI